MLGIVNNVGALNAQNNLTKSSDKLNTSIERLSSGLRINRGADGPAALVISEKQRAQISGLKSAIDNTEKAVSVVQTAEGALNEINSLLVQVRSLAIDSANSGVNDEDALAANQAEIANALETINRIANNTQFGEKKLLDGSAGVNVTASDEDVTITSDPTVAVAGDFDISVTTAATSANVSAASDQGLPLAQSETLTINDVEISLDAGLTQAEVVDRINEFSDETGVTADVDGTTTRLTSNDVGSASTISVVSDQAETDNGGSPAVVTSSGFGNTARTAAVEGTAGTDIVGTIDGEAATGLGNTLTSATGDSAGLAVEIAEGVTGDQGTVSVTDGSLVFQIGANAGQTVSITIDSADASGLANGVADNQFASLNDISVLSASEAQDTLAIVDAAIDEVSNLRGTLGAFQGNTLESTANNLRTTLENTVNAESVIRDTDFAEEISNFTNAQVLVQAGTSVLSNANQSSQLILSLLG